MPAGFSGGVTTGTTTKFDQPDCLPFPATARTPKITSLPVQSAAGIS